MGLFRLLLLFFLFYILFRLIRTFLISRQSVKTGQNPQPPDGKSRVDKTKAEDAEFEEIKDK